VDMASPPHLSSWNSESREGLVAGLHPPVQQYLRLYP
jgi:hypothetical protein